MAAALSIRGDMPAEELRRLARLERDGRVACRLMALANALDGMSRERAAHQAGMDRQTLRDWVIRFNAAGIDGLRDRPRSGRPPFLDEGQMAALKAIVLRGPNPERDGVSAWTARDLCQIALAGILRMTTVAGIDGAVPRLVGQQAGCLRPRS